MEIPQDVVRELQDILKGDFPLFMAAMGQSPHGGLRFNSRKVRNKEYLALGCSEKIPWTEWGFYCDQENAARHPYHHGGIFYIQEPSAMAPAEILSPHRGQWVLDLCAAPGGKSTRLAEFLGDSGFLVANDISNSRCRGLLHNMERFGMKNAVVTNETPERLREHFGPVFDRVLVDAPCSGQGMFRKEPSLLKEYVSGRERPYSQWQREILNAAVDLTAPGGEIVYSTCTFTVAENEAIIDDFLREHHDFYPLPIPLSSGFAPGVDNMPGTVRLWPHQVKGEGHFVAHLAKKGSAPSKKDCNGTIEQDTIEVWERFLAENEIQTPSGIITRHKNALFLAAQGMPLCRGLKVVCRGLYLGDIKKDRFSPSQPWSLSLSKADIDSPLIFPVDSMEIDAYLKGLTVKAHAPKGYHVIFADAVPLGWVKSDGMGTLKNLYPPAWRNL